MCWFFLNFIHLGFFFLAEFSESKGELLCLFAHDITILGKSQVGSPRPITFFHPTSAASCIPI
jgi:hypothetical protein